MPEAPDQSHTFGGGLTESSLTPIVLVGMLVAILLMWILPRKYVVVPFLCFALLVPMGEQVYALGVHWLALRIVILAGWARLLQNKLSSKKPLFAGGFNFIDQAFLVSVVCQAVCMVLQYMQSQALINQFGFVIDY